MGNIIQFHNSPVTGLKKELEKEKKTNKKLQEELAFFKRIYTTTVSASDLLKLQVADLEMNVTLLQGHLTLVKENIKSFKSKLEQVDKMKNQVTVKSPKDKN